MDIVKNVIFRSVVEPGDPVKAKEAADHIRAVTAAQREGEAVAGDWGDAQASAAQQASKQAAVYDATAAKINGLFTRMREGTRAVMEYAASEAPLRKMDAALRAQGGAGDVVSKSMAAVSKSAKAAVGDLEAMKKAARGEAANASAAPATAAVDPIPADGMNIDGLSKALAQLRGETKEFFAEMVAAANGGTISMETLQDAVRANIDAMRDAYAQAEATAEINEKLQWSRAQPDAAQKALVDEIAAHAELSEEQRNVIENAVRLSNAYKLQEEAWAGAEFKAEAYVKQIQEAQRKLDEFLQRPVNGMIGDPGPGARILLEDVEALQASLAAVELPPNSKLEQSVKRALTPTGGAKEEIEAMAEAWRELPQKIEPTVQKTLSLRQQLAEAKKRLDALMNESDGTITPELVEAAKEAGLLANRLDTVNKTVKGMDPGQKFAVLTGVVQNAVGAFTVLQGVMGLFNMQSEDASKALLKVQSALAVTQGLHALFGSLQDNLRNVRLLLSQLAISETRLAVATRGASAATATQTVATTGLSRALTVAQGAVTRLWVALAANPIGVIVAAIGVLIATVYALATAQEKVTVGAERMIEVMDRAARNNALDTRRRKNEEAFASELVYLEEVARIEQERAKLPNTATEQQRALADLRRDEALHAAEQTRRRRDQGSEERALQRELDETRKAGQIANAVFYEFMDKAEKEYGVSVLASRQELVKKLSEEELEEYDKLKDYRKKQLDATEVLEIEANELRMRHRAEEVKAEIDAAARITKARQSIAEAQLPAGSIAEAQRALARLRDEANRTPQGAVGADRLATMQANIAKAEARLRQLQDTFTDTAEARLAERQRAALAMADIEAREAALRLRMQGATEEDLAALEAANVDRRLRIAEEFERERLALMERAGALALEKEVQQAKIAEAARNRAATGGENAERVREAARNARAAELDERERHMLAIADMDERAAVVRAQNAGASAKEIERIERAAQEERLRMQLDFERERLAALVESGVATADEIERAQNRITELQAEMEMPQLDTWRKMLGEIIDMADMIASAGIDAWATWTDAATASLDRQIALQEDRVAKAEELADKGNAAVFEAEKKRLHELNVEREKAARKSAAIAQIEATAQAMVAIARAAAEGGGLASIATISMTLLALAAGFAQAREIASSSVPSFFLGGPADWSTMGGYTGDGDPRRASRAIGRKPYQYEHREFVMDHEVTGIGRNREWFDRILKGRIDVDRLVQRHGDGPVVKVSAGGTSDKQVEQIVNAVKNIPRTSVRIDRRGITMMILGQQQRESRIRSRR